MVTKLKRLKKFYFQHIDNITIITVLAFNKKDAREQFSKHHYLRQDEYFLLNDK